MQSEDDSLESIKRVVDEPRTLQREQRDSDDDSVISDTVARPLLNEPSLRQAKVNQFSTALLEGSKPLSVDEETPSTFNESEAKLQLKGVNILNTHAAFSGEDECQTGVYIVSDTVSHSNTAQEISTTFDCKEHALDSAPCVSLTGEGDKSSKKSPMNS